MRPRPLTTAAALVALLLAGPAAVGTAAPAPAADPAAGDHRGYPGAPPGLRNLDAATIPELQKRMGSGRLTSVELTRAYLARIRAVDDRLGAVLETNPKAIRDAAASDRERRQHGARSPLEGIPVLLKDNIDTLDQGATAGSRALLRSRPDDATIVRRLQDAGAVVIGKANLSEWANFRSTNSSSGWSAVGGQTNNAYALDRNPCGSSSGSAAGVAASLAQVSVGTETDGSIVCPAAANGIVGVKPSVGLVSRDGIVPISVEQDTAGPMARHVVDAALTLSVLQGGPSGRQWLDPADPATETVPRDQTTDYAKALDARDLKGARIGVWRLETDSPETDAITEQAVQALKKAGATPVDVELPYQDVVNDNEFPALLSEFKRDLEAYLAATPGEHPDTLRELIAFNKADPVELRFFGQELFWQALQAPDADSADARGFREKATTAARASIDETLADYELDAIVAPTNSPAWLTTLGEGDAFLFGSSSPAAVAGYPNTTVPAGYSDGLPVGLSFFGARFADAEILSLAYAFEQANDVRRVPRLLDTVG